MRGGASTLSRGCAGMPRPPLTHHMVANVGPCCAMLCPCCAHAVPSQALYRDVSCGKEKRVTLCKVRPEEAGAIGVGSFWKVPVCRRLCGGSVLGGMSAA